MNYVIDLDDKILEFLANNLNLNESKINDVNKKIEIIVKTLVEHENINFENLYVSITSADETKIKDLNNKYRNIDKVTDVLSFPIFDFNELNEFRQNGNNNIKNIELGDIILCLNVIKKQSIEYNTGLERELLYMITHGMCHLLGYDHIEEADKLKMRELEEEALAKIGVNKIDSIQKKI